MLDIDRDRVRRAVGDDKPEPIRQAEAFQKAVEALNTPPEVPDLTAATTANVAKALDKAVAHDLAGEHRARRLDQLQRIAADRLEAAWVQSMDELGQRFREAFDQAAEEFLAELEVMPHAMPGSLLNAHDRSMDSLRDIVRRLDEGHELRKMYPKAEMGSIPESSLTRVCVLRQGSSSAIRFHNKYGRPTGADLWFAMADSDEILRIAWQNSSEQNAQPGMADLHERDRKMRELAAEMESARRVRA